MAEPWYRRTLRWGQTNLNELDPARIDLEFWKDYWKRTQVQGLIVNAGGITAYYPSQLPQHRAKTLGNRDLLGEIFAAGRAAGLSMVARLDSNRAREPFYRLHPDWFSVDRDGHPYRIGEFYLSCVHSPYYSEYMPSLMRELIGRVKPDGFADNSWSGLGAQSVCHCRHCEEGFGKAEGLKLPQAARPGEPAYDKWRKWGMRRRLEIWDLNNEVCAREGGPDCLWAGMMRGGLGGQAGSLRDLTGLARRSKIVFLDYQSRGPEMGFAGNGEAGKLWHELAGWDTVVAESMALYQSGPPPFRWAAKPEPEARLWMLEGMAAGIQPWWHHVGGVQEDRRQFASAPAAFAWHAENEPHLLNRRPLAPVALLWTQETLERGWPDSLLLEPWLGWSRALIRHRIPYRILHPGQLEREAAGLRAAILPSATLLGPGHEEALRRFIALGKGLISGAADDAAPQPLSGDWDRHGHHSYLKPAGAHPIFAGLEGAGLLAFGGRLGRAQLEGAASLAALLPPFPVFPPESSFPADGGAGEPAILLHEASRRAALPADIDRAFARTGNPDLGLLLANLARWACGGGLPLELEGAGLIDLHLYEQEGRRILHLVNLGQPAAWPGPADQWMESGPLKLTMDGFSRARSLVSGRTFESSGGAMDLGRVSDHEVLIFG